ncbi:DUF6709 family protein [Acetatifactor muris]|uniref:DUF6709 family protein n=1 Tax=Acetatifactor muris TaxID=879566 RepID=UPI0023EFD553|nr:DUF6709 family protein [Acetatifactor muris]
MKKLLSIVITLCALAGAAVFWILGGSLCTKMRGGPEELASGTTFSEAEGRYISYEAAYPIASRVEEYYSGDPDRVRTMGYVVYDQERQAFIYIVVSDNDKGRLENLMWDLHLSAEMRAGKDMEPFTAWGSLEPMESEAVEEMLAAVEDSEIVDSYMSSGGSGSHYEAYFNSDEYGKVMAAMGKALEEGWQQSDWYYIVDGSINGLSGGDIWICAFAAGLNLLIAVFRLIALFRGAGKHSDKAEKSGSKLDRFLAAQRDWVEDWCDYSLNRGRRLGYLSVLGGVVIFLAIGIFVKVPVQKLLVFYLSLGVLLGELTGLLFWFGQKGQAKPGKILKKLEKSVKKELPSASEQEDFAEDVLNAGSEWQFREKTKDAMLQGVVGSRYWVALSWNGQATVIDSERLDKIETATISGQVRSGKVRVSYVSYVARFYYRNATPKKTFDKALSFNWEDSLGLFMVLVRKRVGDNVKITAV